MTSSKWRVVAAKRGYTGGVDTYEAEAEDIARSAYRSLEKDHPEYGRVWVVRPNGSKCESDELYDWAWPK